MLRFQPVIWALRKYGWIFERANSVCPVRGGKKKRKKISVQHACTACDTSPCITCRGGLCHSEWPELCSTSSTSHVTMPFGRRSVSLRFELYIFFYFFYFSDSSWSCALNVFSLSLNKLRLLFFSHLHSFTLTVPTDHTFLQIRYRHWTGTRIGFCGLFTLHLMIQFD